MTEHQQKPSSKPAYNKRAELERNEQRVRIGTIWAIQYWRGLFNFRFDRYLIIQVIPGVYGLAVVGVASVLLYASFEAFLQSTWRGLLYLFVGTPFLFLLSVSIIRALLEFYMVIFRIAEDLDQLAGISDTVNKLGDMSETVDNMVSMTRDFSLWSLITGRNKEQ